MTIPELPPDHATPLQNIVTIEGLPGLWLDHAQWLGVPVTLSTTLIDGQMIAIGTPPRQFIIGSRPRTQIGLAGYAARCAVQRGLIDVLDWLGERPLPWPPVTGAEILNGIRRGIV